jgi:hypothetical protein
VRDVAQRLLTLGQTNAVGFGFAFGSCQKPLLASPPLLREKV